MNRNQPYQRFLRSEFWVRLSAQKREIIGKCERCGSVFNLQAHHKRYPKDWRHTTLDMLKVLCRRCHRKEHRIRGDDIFPCRADKRFNEYVHRCGCLIKRLYRNRPLRPRDERFLKWAVRAYPPEHDDKAIQFHVGQVWRLQTMVLEGKFNE
jgi:hypothetical protein